MNGRLENVRLLQEVGYLDENLELTDKGVKAYLELLLNQGVHTSELIESAEKELEEEE